MRALLHRPVPAALLFGLLAQLLFSVNLARPTKPVFDEVHYLPAARALLTLERRANPEHPPLGKELIAGSIGVFGDNPVGWRAASTLAGTATVLGVFSILLLLLGSVRTASYGALLAALNFTLFVHARIAMLEPFLGAFVVGGIAAMLWAMRSPPERVTGRWLLGSLLLGLATAVKWTAAPYVAFAALGFVALRVRRADLWPGLTVAKALVLLGSVSVGAYFATFVPYFYLRDDPLTLATLLPLQWDMYQLQTQVLAPHPYQSGWLSWPFAIRPIWYLYEPVDGAVRGILYLGNPIIMWGGLAAVAWLGWHWWRRRAPVAGAVALLWAASLAIWAAIPKSLGFYYYYHLSGIVLCVAIPVAFHLHAGGRESRALFWFAVFAGALFIRFYPILSAAALPNDQAFTQWMWLNSWR